MEEIKRPVIKNDGDRHLKNSVVKKTLRIPSTDMESLELLDSLLLKCNDGRRKRLLTVTDILLYGLRKIKNEDIKIIQEATLSTEEKAERALFEYNKINGTSLTLAELAMKQLKKERRELPH